MKNSSLNFCLKTNDYVLPPVYISLYVKLKKIPISFAEKKKFTIYLGKSILHLNSKNSKLRST